MSISIELFSSKEFSLKYVYSTETYIFTLYEIDTLHKKTIVFDTIHTITVKEIVLEKFVYSTNNKLIHLLYEITVSRNGISCTYTLPYQSFDIVNFTYITAEIRNLLTNNKHTKQNIEFCEILHDIIENGNPQKPTIEVNLLENNV